MASPDIGDDTSASSLRFAEKLKPSNAQFIVSKSLWRQRIALRADTQKVKRKGASPPGYKKVLPLQPKFNVRSELNA